MDGRKASSAGSPAAPKITLTHSSTAAYRACPRKYYYRYELGLRRVSSDEPSLRIGTAFHAALDVRAAGGSWEDAILAAANLYTAYPRWCVSDDDRREWAYERETVIRLVHGYAMVWGAADAALEFVQTEQSFYRDLVNPETGAVALKHAFAGKIDKVVRVPGPNGQAGKLAIYEHKTTGESIADDSEYWEQLRLDPQVSAYLVAARRLGVDAATVFYDVVHKPQIEPKPVALVDADGFKIVLDAAGNRVFTSVRRTSVCEACGGTKSSCPAGCKKGKVDLGFKPRETSDTEKKFTLQTRPMTTEEWGDKLTADISSRPAFYYARREVARTDGDLLEYEAELWQQQQQINDSRRLGRWFKSVGYTNCRRCEYRNICFSRVGRVTADEPPPEGYERVADVHPELGRPAGVVEVGSPSTAAPPATPQNEIQQSTYMEV